MFVILSSSLHSLEKNTKREMLVTIIEYYNLGKKKKKNQIPKMVNYSVFFFSFAMYNEIV